MEWAPANPEPLTNVAQLIVNGVCRVRNSYIHGEKFVGGPLVARCCTKAPPAFLDTIDVFRDIVTDKAFATKDHPREIAQTKKSLCGIRKKIFFYIKMLANYEVLEI